MCRHHIQNITHFQEFNETQQDDTPTAVLELALLLNSTITQHTDHNTNQDDETTNINQSGIELLDALLNETDTPTTAIV